MHLTPYERSMESLPDAMMPSRCLGLTKSSFNKKSAGRLSSASSLLKRECWGSFKTPRDSWYQRSRSNPDDLRSPSPESAIGVNVSLIRTFAMIVIAGGLTLALFCFPMPGMWWPVIRVTYYLPILFVSARHGALAGLSAGLAASLLYALAAVSRGMSDMPWLSILIPDLALVGLLGGRLLKPKAAFQASVLRKGADAWLRFGRIYGMESTFDMNPIDSIQSAAGLLSEEDTPPEQRRELAGIISTECEHLSASIEGLHQLGLTARQPQFLEIDFGAVIDAAIREVEFILSGSGIIVCKEIAPDLLPVECDPDQIRDLLITLTLNTAQSLPSGSTVFVDAHCADDGVVVNIMDRGRESFLQQFLNRFSGSRTGVTGVALTAAYGIVRQHGGKIKAVRNARKRLGFSLWQPLHRKSPNDSWQGAGGRGR
jgi:hypothetical protein